MSAATCDETPKNEQASPEMKLFFNRLLEIKEFIKECANDSKEPYLGQVYEKLHTLFKEKTNA